MATKLLTAKACEHLKTGILTDPARPGLRLEVSAAKSVKSWIYRYRMQTGVLRQIKLGEYPRMSLEEAREAWAAQKKLRDSLRDPRQERARQIEEQRAAAKIEAAGVYTVDALLADYLRHHVDRKAIKRRAEIVRIIDREILPRWKGRPATEITRRDCVDLFEAVEPRARRVAEQMMSVVRGAFATGMKRARIDVANPATGVGSTQRNDRVRQFTAGESRALWAWLCNSETEHLTPNVRDVMRLTLLTGCRSGEACAAEWREVDLEEGVWTQPATKTKNKRPHRVMLSRQAIDVLRARQGVHDRWVFPSYRNKPIQQKAIGFAQYLMRQESPVADWTVHDLRRMALTELGRLKCPRVVQDRIANHIDRSVAAIYDQHPYDDEAREWLQRLADELESESKAADPTVSSKRRRTGVRAPAAA